MCTFLAANQNKKAPNSEQVSPSASEANGHTPNAPGSTVNEYEHLEEISTAVVGEDAVGKGFRMQWEGVWSCVYGQVQLLSVYIN